MPAALITGGAVRLGRAIALALAEAGYDIAFHCHTSRAEAGEVAGAIQNMGRRCVVLQADLADAEAPDVLIRAAQSALPGLDVVVNSASRYVQAPIAETTPVLFDATFAVNLRAPFFLTQSFARHAGHGQVINVLDNKIAFNQYAYAAYLLSKKGLAELTRIAALEFAPAIRVNAVAPGVILPAETRTPDYLQWRADGIPLRTQGAPPDVCAAVLYLLGSPFVTGQILTVDGGESVAHVGRHAANAPDRG